MDVNRAVAELESLYEQVSSFVAGEDMGNGHESVHRAGLLLSEFSKIDHRSGLNKQQIQEVSQAAKAMLSAYGKMDEALHDKKEFDFSEISTTLTEKLNEIKSIMAAN